MDKFTDPSLALYFLRFSAHLVSCRIGHVVAFGDFIHDIYPDCVVTHVTDKAVAFSKKVYGCMSAPDAREPSRAAVIVGAEEAVGLV